MNRAISEKWLRWGGVVEGCLLVLLGIYMVFFAFGEDYWILLNPKFKWLTAAAGYGLILVGLVASFSPNRPNLSRILSFVLLLGLLSLVTKGTLMTSLQGAAVPSGDERAGSLVPNTTEAQGATSPSRLTRDGREYIKINLGELYNIGEIGSDTQLAQHYLVRGMVQKNAELTGQGQFIILRPAVSCCLADAVSVGFRVAAEGIVDLDVGQWVNVYASLTPSAISEGELESLGLKGVFFTSINAHYLLRVDAVEKTTAPEIPAMFEFHEEEPYAY